jgi:hypothetical protein
VRGDKRFEPQRRRLDKALRAGSMDGISGEERLNMSFSAA